MHGVAGYCTDGYTKVEERRKVQIYDTKLPIYTQLENEKGTTRPLSVAG
jgi:hypothetical protein